MLKQFQRKTTIVEAEQYTEHGKLVKGMCNSQSCHTSGNFEPHVHTIHDNQVVNLEIGDWVLPEPDGHHYYPVKDEIFQNTYERCPQVGEPSGKTLGNTTASQAKDNVKDIIFWGDGDTFKLISKASSKKEGWMKSTKAMQIEGAGCVVQVTTQQGDNVSEAVTWVPGVKIKEWHDGTDTSKVVSRSLVKI